MIFLEIARSGSLLGSDIGNINAFLLKTQDEYELNWYMDMRDANNTTFLKQLKKYKEINDGHDFAKHGIHESFGKIPDLRSYGWKQKF